MYILKSCFRRFIALLVLNTLTLSLVPLIDTHIDLTYNVLAQLGDGTNLSPPNIASDPEKLLESIGSPGNLMDSVLDEVRNTNTSDTSVDNNEANSYSQG
ncbi:MAG: hypothetical protein WAM26_02175, partial [Nitrososphaeraceae archaeon]